MRAIPANLSCCGATHLWEPEGHSMPYLEILRCTHNKHVMHGCGGVSIALAGPGSITWKPRMPRYEITARHITLGPHVDPHLVISGAPVGHACHNATHAQAAAYLELAKPRSTLCDGRMPPDEVATPRSASCGRPKVALPRQRTRQPLHC